ncbi:TetR/AcrR family transcriptional regulator [Nocardia sp. NPDC058379]|uniref:TetR/AcrR family transcriptional regulator n=1 Tax=unclassified Nocardia TaxID=2637762 RepID=UPI0036585CD7
MSARERILDAAAEAMRTRGVAGTTTKEIARVAGCSEPLIYKYFRDKDELLKFVLSERMPAFSGAPTPGAATVEANLIDVVHGGLRFYQRGFPMMASIASQPTLMAATRDGMRKYDAGPHAVVENLAKYLRAEQGLGRVAADADPDAVAALLMGACFQQGFLRYVADDPEAPQSAAEALVRPLLAHLDPTPS